MPIEHEKSLQLQAAERQLNNRIAGLSFLLDKDELFASLAAYPFGWEPYTFELAKRQRQNEYIAQGLSRKALEIEFPHSSMRVLSAMAHGMDFEHILRDRNGILALRMAEVPAQLATLQDKADDSKVTWFQLNQNVKNATGGRAGEVKDFRVHGDVDHNAYGALALFKDHEEGISERDLLEGLEQIPSSVVLSPALSFLHSSEWRLAQLVFAGFLKPSAEKYGRLQFQLRTLPEIGHLTNIEGLGYPYYGERPDDVTSDFNKISSMVRRRVLNIFPKHVETVVQLMDTPGGGEYMLTYIPRLGERKLQAMARLIDRFDRDIKELEI